MQVLNVPLDVFFEVGFITRLHLLLATDIGARQSGADHVAFGPDGHPPALARLHSATQDATLQELSAYMDCSPQERLPTAAQLSRLLERAGVCVPLVRGPLRGECQAGSHGVSGANLRNAPQLCGGSSATYVHYAGGVRLCRACWNVK